jgi:LmbE family N-acetylglucosaminyl deacetylase
MRGEEKVVVKHIYVSPHADDVALSCGGQIISDPARVNDTMILNIFTSESQHSHQNTFQDSINPDRTMEDRSAWDHLAIKADYANLPEALLRGRFPFSIFRRVDDSKIINELYGVVLSYVRSYPDATFYFPAGFGNHVDHLACRDVAFRLIDEDILGKIVLYEDIPYCWLRFIRDQHYKMLLRSIELDSASCAQAFRPGGETIPEYLRRKMVPFPRGKKLFTIVYLSLSMGNVLNKRSPAPKPYRGKVNLTRLNDDHMAKKKDLLYHYRSQIPMLFGNDPEDLLGKLYESFSIEAAIEISKRPPGM